MNANNIYRAIFSFRTIILMLAILAVLAIFPASAFASSNHKQDEEPLGAPAIIPTPEGRRTSAVTLLGIIHTLQDIYFTTRAQEDGVGTYADFAEFQAVDYISKSETPDSYLMGFKLYWFLNETRTDYAIVAIPTEFPEMTAVMVGPSGTALVLVEISTEGDLGPFGPVIEALDESKGSDGSYSFVNMAPFYDPDFRMNLFLTEDESEFGIIMTEDTGTGISGAAMFGFSDSGYVIMEYSPDLPALSEEALNN